jgi:hypothetical protein
MGATTVVGPPTSCARSRTPTNSCTKYASAARYAFGTRSHSQNRLSATVTSQPSSRASPATKESHDTQHSPGGAQRAPTRVIRWAIGDAFAEGLAEPGQLELDTGPHERGPHPEPAGARRRQPPSPPARTRTEPRSRRGPGSARSARIATPPPSVPIEETRASIQPERPIPGRNRLTASEPGSVRARHVVSRTGRSAAGHKRSNTLVQPNRRR